MISFLINSNESLKLGLGISMAVVLFFAMVALIYIKLKIRKIINEEKDRVLKEDEEIAKKNKKGVELNGKEK
jgi:uncharacterized ion transporter superfamily protein YfcC